MKEECATHKPDNMPKNSSKFQKKFCNQFYLHVHIFMHYLRCTINRTQKRPWTGATAQCRSTSKLKASLGDIAVPTLVQHLRTESRISTKWPVDLVYLNVEVR